MVASPEFLRSNKEEEESREACKKKLSSMLPTLLALESLRVNIPATLDCVRETRERGQNIMGIYHFSTIFMCGTFLCCWALICQGRLYMGSLFQI